MNDTLLKFSELVTHGGPGSGPRKGESKWSLGNIAMVMSRKAHERKDMLSHSSAAMAHRTAADHYSKAGDSERAAEHEKMFKEHTDIVAKSKN